MNVIETVDIRLAAYAMARGGGLKLIAPRERGEVLYRLEGPDLEEAEIDYAHFGPRGVTRARLDRIAELLEAVVPGRRA